MTVDELIKRLQDYSESGYGSTFIGIVLHNTIHDIDAVDLSNNQSPEDCVISLVRHCRPQFYLHSGQWKKIT